MAQPCIRVLLVSNTLSCGGAERQITLIANALNQSGAFEVDVLYYAQKGGTFAHTLLREPLFVDKDKLGTFGCVREIARILKRGKYDVMHAAGGGTANLYGRAAALLAGTPAILGMMLGKRHFVSRGMRWGNRFLNLFCNEWSVNNPALIPILKRDLIRIDSSRVHLLYNSFAPANCVNYRLTEETEYDVDKGESFVFCTVGRCVKVKNFPLYLRAAARICEKYDTARFWLIGDGEVLESCKALAQELGISSRVRFWGHRDDVDVALSRADVYVQSSDSEGTPNTVLEAMRASRPIVTTNNTDLSVIVKDAQSGYVTPVSDVDALFAAMEKMLLSDKETLVKMGQYSHALFEESFLEENAVQTWNALYRKLLEKN